MPQKLLLKDILIREQGAVDEIPYGLLLMADPSKTKIDEYLPKSVLYIACLDGQSIACYVLCDIDENTAEIKNIAVDEKFRGRGIGTILINDAISKTRSRGLKKLMIGTGNSSTGQLHLYQKIGFKIAGIKKGFFVEQYDEPITEHGIECRDKIMLIKDL